MVPWVVVVGFSCYFFLKMIRYARVKGGGICFSVFFFFFLFCLAEGCCSSLASGSILPDRLQEALADRGEEGKSGKDSFSSFSLLLKTYMIRNKKVFADMRRGLITLSIISFGKVQ